MAVGPFGPWREVDDPNRLPGPLDDTFFGEFVDLYRALTVVGIPQPIGDEMELWQVAAALGIGTSTPADASQSATSAPSGVKHIPGSAELLEKRLRGEHVEPRAADPMTVLQQVKRVGDG